MINIIKGDLLKAEQVIIAHQVNCQGVMGSGVAKAIRDKYPKAYHQYQATCQLYGDAKEHVLSGCCQEIIISDNRIVANLFGQINFGGDGKRYTSYAHLATALNDLFTGAMTSGYKEVAVPYKMGCDRGGGDWEIVYSMLEDFSNKYNIDVYIYQL